MAIKYDPAALLRKVAPKKKIERMVSSRVTLKKASLSFVSDIDFLDRKSIERVALKTIKGYKKRVKADSEIKSDLLDDPKQLIQRVQNEVVFQVAGEIKGRYAGEAYTWLPSSAEEPDPEHQLNYGVVFQVGDGEMPGERYGCQCGMLIHVKESSLDL